MFLAISSCEWEIPYNSPIVGNKANFSFKSLLAEAPRGQPLGAHWMAEHGLTAKHASRLAKDGWLRRLGYRAYVLTGDPLDRDACLAWLTESVPGLHVGGKTALAWRGVRHNLAVRETLSLWGDGPAELPAWLTAEFPAHYQATHLFDARMPGTLGVGPLPAGRAEVLVSSPERALLELLSDVGKRQTLEEATHLVEAARSLRLPVLEQLFSHLTRIKVVRLAHAIADELELPWKSIAAHHSDRLGGGKRWVSVGKTGERLDLKRKP